MSNRKKAYVSVHREAIHVPYFSHEAAEDEYLALNGVRHLLDPKPRIRIIDKPLGKRAVRKIGYDEARSGLARQIPQLPRSLPFRVSSVRIVRGMKQSFVGLNPDYDTNQALQHEEAELITSMKVMGEKVSAKLLLVARTALQDELALSKIEEAFVYDIEHNPQYLEIQLGQPELKASKF